MTGMVITHVGYAHQDSNAKVWRAVVISLALHAVVVVIYPHLSKISLPKMPDRLEIEFFTMKAASSSQQQVTPEAPTPPAPQKVEPTPKVFKPQVTQPEQTNKPVLSAPSHDADYHVQEQAQLAKTEPAPAVTPPVAAPITTTTSSHESTHQTTNEEHNKDTTKAATSNPATNNTSTNNESEELTASDSDAWGDYGDQLRALVGKSKQYPAIAIRRHLEGDVTVVAQFVRGELTQVSLSDSSKHAPLDEEALRMVKKAIAQLGVKESLKKKSFRITIPVSFRLD
jgi:periplasmic protein TonB